MGDEILVREILSYFLAKNPTVPGLDIRSRLIVSGLETTGCARGSTLLPGNMSVKLSTSFGNKSLLKKYAGSFLILDLQRRRLATWQTVELEV